MSAAHYRLVIGNKTWSSWSLRPWLLMTRFGIPFEEIVVGLRQSTTAAQIAHHSPSGKVPVLIDGPLSVWDSLAIAEYLAERHPDLPLWPQDAGARAIARSVSAEMHSGFAPLRQNCPMDVLARGLSPVDPAAVAADVSRIVAIWGMCRAAHGGRGPFLFSQFSVADAMFAPVASRFATYGIDLGAAGDDGTAAAYAQTLMNLPEMADWINGARDEPV
jgi:glutathione S-transferase